MSDSGLKLTSESETEARERLGKKRFRVGQGWQSRSGSTEWAIVAITPHGKFPIVAQHTRCGDVNSFDRNGYCSAFGENHPNEQDLVTLISDVP